MSVWIVGWLLLAPAADHAEEAYRTAIEAKSWERAESAAQTLVKADAARAADFLSGEYLLAHERAHQLLLVRVLLSFAWSGLEEFAEEESLSDDPTISALAARTLLKLKPEKASTLVIESTDPGVRLAALRVLVNRDPKRAMAFAIRALETARDPKLRAVAYDLVATHGDGDAARRLVLVCGQAPRDEKERAVQALGRMPIKAIASLGQMNAGREARLLAARVILARASEPLRTSLQHLRDDRDPRIALVAKVGLQRLAGGKPPNYVVQYVSSAKDTDAKLALYKTVVGANVRDPELARALSTHIRKGSNLERIHAAEAFGVAGGPIAIPMLRAMLATKRPWVLSVAAARGLAATRARGAIPVLIRELKTRSGRVQHEILGALFSLTGVDFGHVVPNWEKWWKEYGRSFRVSPVPARKKGKSGTESRYAFYGIPLHSDAVAFVCDISGSMEGAPLATLKKQLLAVLKSFPPTGRFNIICFESNVTSWASGLRNAGDKAKSSARGFVDAMATRGATNLWGGLMRAFSDDAADTIVLLSDGSPSGGKITDPAQITSTFLKRNKERMVRVHVICIGWDQPQLRRLAEKTGGTYVVKKR